MRLVLMLAVATALTLATAVPAFGHKPNEHGIVACAENVENQTEMGVEAGGGPKEGIVAPTNCDHFFFEIGAIGNEHSGGP
jgi:hypothetical protein